MSRVCQEPALSYEKKSFSGYLQMCSLYLPGGNESRDCPGLLRYSINGDNMKTFIPKKSQSDFNNTSQKIQFI